MGNCCSQKRTAWNGTAAIKQDGANASLQPQGLANKTDKKLNRLKYIGDTSLTLRGNVSRKIYHFTSAQAVLEIEPEDLNSIVSNPFLSKVL